MLPVVDLSGKLAFQFFFFIVGDATHVVQVCDAASMGSENSLHNAQQVSLHPSENRERCRR